MIIGVSGSYHKDTEVFAKLLADKLEFQYKNIPLGRFFRKDKNDLYAMDRLAFYLEQFQNIFDFVEEKLEAFNPNEDIITGVTPLEQLSHFMALTSESAVVMGHRLPRVKKMFEDISMNFYARAFELTNRYYNFQVHFQPSIRSYLSRRGMFRSFIYQEHQNAILTGLFVNCMVCTIQVPREIDDIPGQVDKIASDFLLFRENREEAMKDLSNLKNIN